MNRALELIQRVESKGGQLRVEDGFLVIAPKEAAELVVEELRKHKSEIIGLLQSRPDLQLEGALDDGWGLWLLERCVFCDRWWEAAGALYLDLARWCADHGLPVPASRRAFVAVLKAEGFHVRSDGFVYGLVLKEDLEAHERFHTADNTSIESEPSGGIARD